MELTEGCKSSTASASLGAPMETTTTPNRDVYRFSMGSEGTAAATISSTMEGVQFQFFSHN